MSLTSKPTATVARENLLRRQEEETRLKQESIVIWWHVITTSSLLLGLDCNIIENQYSDCERQNVSVLTVFSGGEGGALTPVPPFITMVLSAALYTSFVLSIGLQISQDHWGQSGSFKHFLQRKDILITQYVKIRSLDVSSTTIYVGVVGWRAVTATRLKT